MTQRQHGNPNVKVADVNVVSHPQGEHNLVGLVFKINWTENFF